MIGGHESRWTLPNPHFRYAGPTGGSGFNQILGQIWWQWIGFISGSKSMFDIMNS